jgi:hypothetical protein
MAVRILIADDHVIVRRGLRSWLESQPGWEVCAASHLPRSWRQKGSRVFFYFSFGCCCEPFCSPEGLRTFLSRDPIPISIAVFLGKTTSCPRAMKCE